MPKQLSSANEAWKQIIEDYDIVRKVADEGIFHIKASTIKKYREPRLMAKWDSSSHLPAALKDNKLNILPDSRKSYVLGDFLLYKEIPETLESVHNMDYVELPEYESIDVRNISSESNAINVLILSGILDDFLEDEDTVGTFNGRMGTGKFDFKVNTYREKKVKISVENAQCEIDGGFENINNVIIMEAKNVLNEDFHVRQLYYPYRLWKTKVNKPIRLIFSIYSNMIYRLFEYEFTDIYDYSSVNLVRTKNYSLQDTSIENEDLINVRNNSKIKFDDNQEKRTIPFIQADSFDRIISLLENLKDNPMSTSEIAELMEFHERQSDYYFNAGAYLGLFEKKKEDGQTNVCLTKLGEKIYKLDYKSRQLSLVELMLEHQIFADCFDYVIDNAWEMPPKSLIMDLMRKYNVCNEGQILRRAGSVQGWLKWIFNLKNL